jgi:hypothetical protein
MCELQKYKDLFALRRQYDDKTILDDLDVASVLLKNKCGEIGFCLGNIIDKFVKDVRDIKITSKKEVKS